MAITTYSELKTAIGNWLNRTDLTARIPEFISLAEAKFKRELRTVDMEKRATTDATGEYTAVPSDMLEIRSAYLNTDPKQQLENMSVAEIRRRWMGSSTGQPQAFAIVGNEILLAPSPDGTYELELDYYAFSVLSDSNTANWLLTTHPDAYLYGALLEATPYIKNDARVQMWAAMLKEVLSDIHDSDWSAAHPGPLRIIAG